MVYNQKEDNSIKEAANLAAACKTMGITSITVPYADESKLVETYAQLIASGKIDCILFSKDTLLVKHLQEISQLIIKKKIIAITIDEGSIDASILGLSLSHTDLGLVLAKTAVRILRGEKKPSEIEPATTEKYMVMVNLKVAKAVGVKIPVDLIRSANKVIKE
jgi:putative ABC transport system substrate-binding protein